MVPTANCALVASRTSTALTAETRLALRLSFRAWFCVPNVAIAQAVTVTVTMLTMAMTTTSSIIVRPLWPR
jgi:hypothetical protein